VSRQSKSCLSVISFIQTRLQSGRNNFWKNAADIFVQGEKQDPELNVKDLHVKIGQLAVENDFLSNAFGRIDEPSTKR